jgi:hypothetical protein
MSIRNQHIFTKLNYFIKKNINSLKINQLDKYRISYLSHNKYIDNYNNLVKEFEDIMLYEIDISNNNSYFINEYKDIFRDSLKIKIIKKDYKKFIPIYKLSRIGLIELLLSIQHSKIRNDKEFYKILCSHYDIDTSIKKEVISRDNGFAFIYPKVEPELIDYALSIDGSLIRKLPLYKQTEKRINIAIRQKYYNCKYILKPLSIKQQMEIAVNSPKDIKYIKNAHNDVREFLKKEHPIIFNEYLNPTKEEYDECYNSEDSDNFREYIRQKKEIESAKSFRDKYILNSFKTKYHTYSVNYYSEYTDSEKIDFIFNYDKINKKAKYTNLIDLDYYLIKY